MITPKLIRPSTLRIFSSMINHTASNYFYYLDTNRNAVERPAQAAYNRGFAARKAILGTSNTVSYEIPLNRYGFFEVLKNQLLPNSKVEIQVTVNVES